MVTEPPQRPVLVYDGDCGFCRRWVARWRDLTGDRVEYVPSAEVGERFPQVPRARFDAAVVLITPDGDACSGAVAVFTALERAPYRGWMLRAYRKLPGFARVTEWIYRLVARHRSGFSALSRLLWGRDPSPSTFVIGSWLYLRLLGLTFLIAFVSLWTQVDGLVGSDGILPVAEYLSFVGERIGGARFWRLPTLLWLNDGDAALHALCLAGTALSLLMIAGIAQLPVLALLWLCYLSLAVGGQVFLSFQWDTLLLEAGFMGLLLAPGRLLPWRSAPARPRAAGLWLQRLLLFKLMFLSGVTKLLSGDSTWRDLTALDYHYQTQPLPSWIGYYLQHLPDWMHRSSVVTMFVIEIGLPFLIFGPRRLRHLAGAGFILLQLMIAAAGSYCFFNLLAIALCVPLFDDRLLRRLMPAGLRGRFDAPPRRPPRRAAHAAVLVTVTILTGLSGLTFLREMVHTQRRDMLPGIVVGPLDACDRYVLSWGRPLLRLTDPFMTINGYGLFRVMTTHRPEIIVEGTDDGLRWRVYEFKWKPGDVKRRPRFAAPHQPRLDWQMWFAALNPQGNAHWLNNLVRRLLEGSPEVLELLAENPFPDRPPRSIRLLYYDYRFSDLRALRETGVWWRREHLGVLAPPMSLAGH